MGVQRACRRPRRGSKRLAAFDAYIEICRTIMTTIASRLQVVKARISEAARAAGRAPEEITLVAVSKTFPPQAIAEASAAGQTAFGENYAQEGIEKMAALSHPSLERQAAFPEGPLLRPLEWHHIGPIQSNKTKPIAENFDWVHGIDRAKIAERLSASRPDNKPPLQVCIQVNVSGEASKSGVAPDAVFGLAQTIMRLPRMRLRGLMAIPEPTPDTALQRSRFRMLREIRDDLLRRGIALDTLSMGMSDDLEAAIAEGATLVRVGRAIFGERGAGAG
ncbi:MAG: YggS family pyridoxal phosphate-dependent enzyme [Methylocella sp.]